MINSNLNMLLEDNIKMPRDTISIRETMNALARYNNYLDDEQYTVGTEGIINVFSRIIDSFISVFNNVKASLMKFNKLVKRSELKYYIQSNRTNVMLVNRTDYTKIADLEIPIPVGMKVDYIEFTKTISSLINSIDMVNKVEQTLSLITDIFLGLEKGTIKGPISGLYSIFDKEYSNHIFKELKKIIDLNSKKVTEVKFNEMFKSVGEFVQCVDDTLSLSFIYDDIQKSSKVIDKILNEFDKIIDVLEHNKINIPKSDIRDLSNVAYMCAQMFEQYGTLTIVYNRLEHNLVEVYKTLKSNV